MSPRYAEALERLYPVHGVDPGAPWETVFDRGVPVVLEIGSGMGESTVEVAAADPGRDYLAIEVHEPGIGNLLAMIAERGITNLRVLDADALTYLRTLPDGVFDAVCVFFPDPWPKVRHHKRRLIQPDNVALLRSKLRMDGSLYCATDWEHYGKSMLDVLSAADGLRNPHGGFGPRPSWRPMTKFETRGVEAGRGIYDLEFRRTA
ncbi:MAG TPA: tRNA (guanosine(46)-N7)-methyltransferase TrmB [Stackebrandtia sp.]|jgi:tRNA (guanine-N7-)-methyltransferase|uniref:tRNA (guanosine(46)-N7)-methyltransferase TrmB n=1 Tax=Stackebrandtia sp. TaxID=2023065 RepID=UPI002D56EEA1|nr:tRNA (guanosine(46)-N7)-methyltransferase TrmB [Stackebrandtia sp.]HZE40463.1 tRNA (guanosine(46)-N7)-methyltransferase TrmB [Stackebrandtia sp.]